MGLLIWPGTTVYTTTALMSMLAPFHSWSHQDNEKQRSSTSWVERKPSPSFLAPRGHSLRHPNNGQELAAFANHQYQKPRAKGWKHHSSHQIGIWKANPRIASKPNSLGKKTTKTKQTTAPQVTEGAPRTSQKETNARKRPDRPGQKPPDANWSIIVWDQLLQQWQEKGSTYWMVKYLEF